MGKSRKYKYGEHYIYPETGGFRMDVFNATVAQNSQVTLKKKLREELGIEPGDTVFLKVIRVISPLGLIKFPGGESDDTGGKERGETP